MRLAVSPLLLGLLGLLIVAPPRSAVGEPAALKPGALKPDEARGKQIYTLGTSASGIEIKAVLGEEGAGTEVAASALPCAGCHGAAGQGGKEGGVRPSNLTREALGRAVTGGGGEGGGRRHPAYDDRLLVRAITLGIDPAGNRLHVAMPRYRLTRQDATDLLAYLKRLGHEEEPGLSAGTLHLGVLLSGGDRQESQAAALQAALTARGAELDREGGLYGRRLALRFVQLPEPPAERAAKLREVLAGEPVFALIAVALGGDETGVAAAAAAAGVPLIDALDPHPREEPPLDRQVFYLTPGLAEQVAALVEAAARELPRDARTLSIVRSAAPEEAGLAQAAEAAARSRGFTVEPAGSALEPAAAALLLLGGGDGGDGGNSAARELLGRAQALGNHPMILMPASLAGDDLFAAVPASAGDRLLVALPVLPPDPLPAAAEAYRRLAAAGGLPAHHVASQMAAVAALEVLIEGLQRAGQDLSREKLIAALETLYRFDAGLGAPVSFGPNRRIGARGAFVAAVDLARHTLGGQVSWIDLDP
jgi:ABC-type branched-subunit amino acid transport system substrate-binding protein